MNFPLGRLWWAQADEAKTAFPLPAKTNSYLSGRNLQQILNLSKIIVNGAAKRLSIEGASNLM